MNNIMINYLPTEYATDDGQTWECQHVDRDAEVMEDTASYEYNQAIGNTSYPLSLEYVEICTSCGDIQRLNIERDEDEC